MKLFKYIFIFFLFFSVLTVAVGLNCKVNKLSKEVKESKTELADLNEELKKSYMLIGEIDNSTMLPE
jgi:hypothetical protein